MEKTDSNEGNFAYIDVGGGSTEVSLIHDGTLAESFSYNMGILRQLSGRVTVETEDLFRQNLTRYAEKYGNIRIIGSGGNINKLNKLARHSKNANKELSLAELKRLYQMMQPLSIEEREISFSLREDRADVIIPAAEIFIKACEYLQCDNIMVPNISLADSIVDGLYEKTQTPLTSLNSPLPPLLSKKLPIYLCNTQKMLLLRLCSLRNTNKLRNNNNNHFINMSLKL